MCILPVQQPYWASNWVHNNYSYKCGVSSLFLYVTFVVCRIRMLENSNFFNHDFGIKGETSGKSLFHTSGYFPSGMIYFIPESSK